MKCGVTLLTYLAFSLFFSSLTHVRSNECFNISIIIIYKITQGLERQQEQNKRDQTTQEERETGGGGREGRCVWVGRGDGALIDNSDSNMNSKS